MGTGGGANPQGSGGRDASSPTTSDSGPDACPDDSRPAVRRALNLLLLVDDSLSVVLQPAWNSLTLAITAFVDDSRNAGLGLGIEYYGSSCTAGDYGAPNVRIAPLPGNAASIKASYPVPISGKALTPAVSGALSYLHVVAGSDTSRDAAMILVTDGIADPICGSTVTNASQEISAGHLATPSVATYVIALGAGPTLLDPANLVDLSPLDDLAAAGGTTQATRIEVNLSTNTALTAALTSAAESATPCAFEIPSDMNANRALLEWHDGTTTVEWPRVADAASCGTKVGAYVRKDLPGYLELCPSSCATLRTAAKGTVFVRSACGP